MGAEQSSQSSRPTGSTPAFGEIDPEDHCAGQSPLSEIRPNSQPIARGAFPAPFVPQLTPVPSFKPGAVLGVSPDATWEEIKKASVWTFPSRPAGSSLTPGDEERALDYHYIPLD